MKNAFSKTSLTLILSGAMLLSGCTSEKKTTTPPVEEKDHATSSVKKTLPLTPAEKFAIKFVQIAYVHPDPAKVDALSDSHHIPPGAFTDEYIESGKVKVASYDIEFDQKKVVVFLPLSLCDLGNRVEVELEKKNGKWKALLTSIKGAPVSDFTEFQLEQFWLEKGSQLKWKDAEL